MDRKTIVERLPAFSMRVKPNGVSSIRYVDGAVAGADPEDEILDELLTVLRSLQVHIRTCGSNDCASSGARNDNSEDGEGLEEKALDGSDGAADATDATSRPSLEPDDSDPQATERGQRRKTRSESPERKHVCPVCFKSFPWLCILKKHLQTHKGVRVFRCGVCGFMTRKAAELQRHQAVHKPRAKDCDAMPCTRVVTRPRPRHSRSAERPSRQLESEFDTNQFNVCVQTSPLDGQHRTFACEECVSDLAATKSLFRQLAKAHDQPIEKKHTSPVRCAPERGVTHSLPHRPEGRYRPAN